MGFELNKEYPLYSGINNIVMGYIIPKDQGMCKVKMYEAKMITLDADSIDKEFGKDFRTWDAAIEIEKQYQELHKTKNCKIVAYADIDGYRSIDVVVYLKTFVEFEISVDKFEFSTNENQKIKAGFYIKGTPHFHLDDLGFPPEVYGWKSELDMV